jgi:hypothetical protein
MLKRGQLLGNDVTVEERAEHFTAFGLAYWGLSKSGAQSLVIEMFGNVVLRQAQDLANVPGLPKATPMPGPQSSDKLANFSLPQGIKKESVRSAYDWLRDPALPTQTRKQRLLRLAKAVAQQEEARAGAGKCFVPYLCYASTLVGPPPAEEIWLLGPAFDFRYEQSDFALPGDLSRFVSRSYAANRALGAGLLPPTEAARVRHMRYPLALMIWETATGTDQHPVDSLQALDLPAEWQTAQNLIAAWLGPDGPAPTPPLIQACEAALGLRATVQPAPVAAAPTIQAQSPRPPRPTPVPAPSAAPTPRPPPTVATRPPVRPNPSTAAKGWSWPIRIAIGLALLLAGVALPVAWLCYLYNTGPLALYGTVTRDRLQSQLGKFAVGDEKAREEALQLIDRIDKGNVNVRYLDLRRKMNDPRKPEGWDSDLKAVKQRAAEINSYDDGDPFHPIFRAEDVELLEAYGANPTWSNSGPLSAPRSTPEVSHAGP